MENVFKYHGMWFDRGLRGNIHLRRSGKSLRNGARIEQGKWRDMEENRGRII